MADETIVKLRLSWMIGLLFTIGAGAVGILWKISDVGERVAKLEAIVPAIGAPAMPFDWAGDGAEEGEEEDPPSEPAPMHEFVEWCDVTVLDRHLLDMQNVSLDYTHGACHAVPSEDRCQDDENHYNYEDSNDDYWR